jgi:hypothetical protein
MDSTTMSDDRSPYSVLPVIGCSTIALVLVLVLLMPLFFFDLMRSALERLHLSPGAALISVIGIFVGSAVKRQKRRWDRPIAIAERNAITESSTYRPLRNRRRGEPHVDAAPTDARQSSGGPPSYTGSIQGRQQFRV